MTGLTNIILSGCPSGGSANGYQLQLHDRTSGDYPIGDYDKGRLLTLDPTHIYEVMIVIRSNITVDNLTYKPMVRLASITDDTYEPYAKTNQELTAENEALTSAFVNNVNENGCKNRFIFDIEEIIQNNTGGTWSGYKFTKGGATFTIDGDSVIFGGTPTGYVNFIFYQKISKPAIYILSGLKDCTNVLFGGCTLYLNGSQVSSIVINSKNDTTLDLSAYTFDTISIDVKRQGNNVAMSGTAFIMLCLKSDWDLDPTYAPPTKTNQQLTKDTTGLIDSQNIDGCKNHFGMSWSGSVNNGITYQANGDNTITANGTVTTSPSAAIGSSGYITGLIIGETYVLSGLPEPTTLSGGEAFIKLYKNDNSYSEIKTSSGNKTLTFTYDDTNAKAIDIGIRTVGTVVTNAVFKPMICLKSLYDADPTFVPYAKSNKELTEKIDIVGNLFTTTTKVVDNITHGIATTVATLGNLPIGTYVVSGQFNSDSAMSGGGLVQFASSGVIQNGASCSTMINQGFKANAGLTGIFNVTNATNQINLQIYTANADLTVASTRLAAIRIA